jgi:AcrR family transcriptional regulator
MARATTHPSETSDRILDAALDAFGTRGYEATSLDALAATLGLTKQTILYWFGSKEGVLEAVVDRSALQLAAALEAELGRARPGDDRTEVVMRTVFRFAVRRPALLGLLREVNRLGPDVAAHLAVRVRPLADRATVFLGAEMEAGSIRRTDPRLLLLLVYATVVGVATEVEAQQVLGLEQTPASLRQLRRALFAFVGAALRP